MKENEEFILSVTDKGFGKRSSAFEYRKTKRGGLGIANKIKNLFKCNEATPPVATSNFVIDGGERKDQSDKQQQSSISKAFNAANNAFGRVKDAKDGLLDGIEGGLSNFEENYGEFEVFGSKLGSARDAGIGDCSNTGNEFNCGMPSIEFFGGDGFGAAGKVLSLPSIIKKEVKEGMHKLRIDLKNHQVMREKKVQASSKTYGSLLLVEDLPQLDAGSQGGVTYDDLTCYAKIGSSSCNRNFL